MNLKIIHTADIHFGKTFIEHSSRVQKIFKEGISNSFKYMIDFAIKERVDILIIAGDLLDIESRFLNNISFINSQLYRLLDTKTKIYMVTGNHDYFLKKNDLATNVNLLGLDELEVVECEKYRIIARSYDNKYMKAINNIPFFKSDKYNIAIFHSIISNANNKPSYLPITSDVLYNSNIDYFALGHIHKSKLLSEFKPFAAYPGSLSPLNKRDIIMQSNGFYYKDKNGIRLINTNSVHIDIVHIDINYDNFQEIREDYMRYINDDKIKLISFNGSLKKRDSDALIRDIELLRQMHLVENNTIIKLQDYYINNNKFLKECINSVDSELYHNIENINLLRMDKSVLKNYIYKNDKSIKDKLMEVFLLDEADD